MTSVFKDEIISDINTTFTPLSTLEPTYCKEAIEPVHEEIDTSAIESPLLSRDDIELIALVTMAEAEGECEEGQRLVIDTILNRLDSEKFPDSIHDVIYQENQFSSVWNGRVDRCTVTDELCQLVEEELKSRTSYDVVFFRAEKYGNYGTPMFSVGNHYFSSK